VTTSRNTYQLLDFGDGRRLERFGAVTLDRPCPAAEFFSPADPDAWALADARFEGREQQKGMWTDRRTLPERWMVAHGSMQFELKRTDFGHVGLFPEQAENWDWIAGIMACRLERETKNKDIPTTPNSPHPLPISGHRPKVGRERGVSLKILNLFAYTGGSTLAAAKAGAEVVHVDAAKNVVAWARRNAELSGLTDASIRWIAEDAEKFAKRELKRGNYYDAVILDPPSYGHGPRGEVWQLSKHLPGLLSLCHELTAGRAEFMLLTCHTPGYDAKPLSDMLEESGFTASSGLFEAKQLVIRTADGRELPSGAVVRWKRK
jgi:23S rRNA (cytosine1962-C5)-methyltransferase